MKTKNMTQETLKQLKELNNELVKLYEALDRLIYSEMELRDKLQKVVELLQNK